MRITMIYPVLLLAALLEAGGDALVRRGLTTAAGGVRIGLLTAGMAVLSAYGVVVNLPSWDFGRVLGVYVTLFFLVAQIINLTFFGVRPGLPVIVGGALIMSGGMVVTFWRQ